MQQAFGIEIPISLGDVIDRTRSALLVYDMQIGIINQLKDGEAIVKSVAQVLTAARNAGVRVFFTRHLSLPKELM